MSGNVTEKEPMCTEIRRCAKCKYWMPITAFRPTDGHQSYGSCVHPDSVGINRVRVCSCCELDDVWRTVRKQNYETPRFSREHKEPPITALIKPV